MKVKHFLSGATLLSAALLLNAPLSAAVESDVVGYTTITTREGFNMYGAAYRGLDGESISLNELLSGDFQDTDEVQVFEPGTGEYSVYKYTTGKGWTRGFQVAKDLAPGTAFWLKLDRVMEVTFKGAVSLEDYECVAEKPGFNMVATGIPIAFNINGDLVEWKGFQKGDQLQIMDANGEYAVYSYSESDGKWVKGFAGAQDVIVPIGSSMWLKVEKAGASMIVKNPAK